MPSALPRTLRIRQHLESAQLADAGDIVRKSIEGLTLPTALKPGASVAVGCSSRGIDRYDDVVRATVDGLKARGLAPFLVPAMGSHGAATAAGQRQVLADAGISEETMGAPVRSSLAVVEVARTQNGLPALVDRNAWDADYMVVVNRIKSHTEFEHEFESGLQKMLAIGLGKEAGATLYHQAFMVDGYPAVIRAIADCILDSGRVLFGVGVIEDGFGRCSQARALTPAQLRAGERELLVAAKQMAPALPFDDVDVLVVEEMGKEISGTGIDTKVVGRILMPLVSPEPVSPRVKRIVALGLTERTRGNADGIGLADFATRRLVDAIDTEALYANAMAGAEPEHAKIPMTMANDKEAIEAAVASVGRIATNDLRLLWIRNTAQLEEMEASEAYRAQIDAREDLVTVRESALALPFDESGRLLHHPLH